MDRVKIARETLMTAMITVFGLFGIDKFIHPAAWLGWVAPWIENLSGISQNRGMGYGHTSDFRSHANRIQ